MDGRHAGAGIPLDALGRRDAHETAFGQGFVPGNGAAPGQFLGDQGIAVFHREQVSAAKESGVLGQADVIGQPVVVHGDPFLRKGAGEIGLPGDAVPGKIIAEQLLDGLLFGFGNAHSVGFHPAREAP